MASINFIPINTKFDFVGKRRWAFGFSLLLTLGSLLAFFIHGFHYGVDFKGGFLIVLRTPVEADLGELRHKLSQLNLGDITLQEFGSKRDISVRVPRQPGDDKAQAVALDRIKEGLGSGIEYRQIETVGPKAGGDLIKNGVYAIFWSLLAMLAYIWFRFEWQFALCAIVALLHDCVVIVGMYSVFPIEFNITAIVAILLTACYSINDTVVIYDRIRENMRKFKKMPIETLINLSINETLSRTVLTSTTTLLAMLALYLLGGELIAQFSLPIIIGIIVGTCSSISLSALLLLYFNVRESKILKEKSDLLT